jgi:hypothetical protein
MSAYVIETNVPVAANGFADHVSSACVVKCLRCLERIHASGIVVLDDGGRILGEYTRHLNRSGQPGAGDFFMKWIWLNQSVPERCEQVRITPLVNDPENFSEFPTDSRLESFDRSDRKFVAVAKASQKRPAILNATDTDWWDHRVALAENGVVVEFLCPDQFRE